jgi:uncharacterized membrane-anchored protein
MQPSEHDHDADHPACDPRLDPEFAPPPGRDGVPPTPVGEAADRAIGWVAGHAWGLLVVAVVFQVGVLLAMIGLAARPLVASGGRTVLLHVMPVDPRDLFRGDYVTLSYDVSSVSSQLEPGQTVYVQLVPAPDGRHFRPGTVTISHPGAGAGVVLRGTVVRRGVAEFGLEKFFVPEGQGRDYERAVLDHRLWAEATVAPDGSAGLRRLVIE